MSTPFPKLFQEDENPNGMMGSKAYIPPIERTTVKIFPLSGNKLIDVVIGLLIILVFGFAFWDIYASGITPSNVTPSDPATPSIYDDFDVMDFF